jgi:protein SCO1/2
VALVNQDDKSIRFYSDLVKGRSVAIEFIYTTCTTICPLLGITFSQVQDLLGDRLGKEVALISISVDPVTDTPQRLKAWGAKFHAKPGWTFLTGKKSDIDKVLRALGAATGRKEDHPPTILMGNEAQGRWTRAYGLAPPGRIVAFLDGMPKGPGVPPARGEGRAK